MCLVLCTVLTGGANCAQAGSPAVIADQWVNGYVQPKSDVALGGTYDLSNAQLIQSGDGFTTLVYSRKLVTGDSHDNVSVRC